MNYQKQVNILQWKQSLSNCFEVNINSNKLNQLIGRILQFCDIHEKKISHLSRMFDQYKSQFQTKTINLEEQIIKRGQIVNMRLNEHTFQSNLLIKEIDSQYEKKMKDNQMRIQILNDRIVKLKQLDSANKKQIQELRYKVFGNYEKNQVNLIQQKINQSLLEKVEIISNGLKNIQSKQKDHFQSIIQKIMQIQEFRKKKQHQKQDQFTFIKKLKEDQRKLQLASFSAKLQKLQNHIKEKQNIAINKVVYPNSFFEKDEKSLKKKRAGTYINIRGEEQDGQGNVIKTYQSRLSKKLVGIEESFKGNLTFIQNQMKIFKNKCLVNEQKNSFIMRKIDKLHHENIQLRKTISKSEDKKVDDKIIEGIKNMVKLHMKDTQTLLQSKLQQKQFKEFKKIIDERIDGIYLSLSEKSDKNQIKKAIFFLEDKIKQIIILLADTQTQEKNGAISKLPFKCLSCDKDIINMSTTVRNFEGTSRNKKSYKNIRTITQQAQRDSKKLFQRNLFQNQTENSLLDK